MINELNPDAACLMECNVNWQKVSMQNRLPECTLGWFEALHLNMAYNMRLGSQAASLAGGVSLWSLGKGTHQVMEAGRDPTGLG